MAIVCLNELDGISAELCESGNPLTILTGIALTTPDFEFESFSAFATEATWKAGIVAGKIFPIQKILEQENIGQEDNVTTTGSGDMILNYEGKRGKRLKFKLPLEMHKVLRTYSGKNLKLIKFDRANNVIGTSPDGVSVNGFDLSYFRVPKLEDASNDGPAYSVLEYLENDVNEMDRDVVTMNPTWLASKINGVLKVEATPSTCAAFTFSVVVQYVDNSGLLPTGANRTAAISGLLVGNFNVINELGAVIVPTSATESTTVPGTYTIVTAAMVSGSVQVIPTATALYKSEIESVTAAV